MPFAAQVNPVCTAVPAAFSRRLHGLAAVSCALAMAFAIVAILGTHAARSAADAPPPRAEIVHLATAHGMTPADSGTPEAPRG